MSANGKAERNGAIALLKTLGVLIIRGSEDGVQLPRTPSGKVGKYVTVRWGRPIPTASGRIMVGGEEKQPHIMPMTFVANAGILTDAEDLAADITDLMLGAKVSDDSTELKGAGGYSFTRTNGENKPTRFEESVMFTTILNLAVG